MRRALAMLVAVLLAVSVSGPAPARARDLFESDDGEFRLTLRSALKGSWLLTFPADDPLLDESTGGAALFRLRFDLGARLGEHLSTSIAYEHRAFATSGTALGLMGGGGVLPPNVPAPFRLTPLDWGIVESGGYTHRHELDRAYVSLHLPFLELTAGRQAIGLGRGVLFSALDVFAPFSPTEVDREWRRGVDAIHAELRIPEISALSADVIAVFGNVESGELESWALLGRIRAVVGDVDGEVIVGRRGEDDIVGGAMSATIGDAEVHGELALFGTDGRGIDGGLFGTRAVVGKALLGASYMIDFWRGIRVVLEYHYSGFGIENVGRSSEILFDPSFQARLLRGDTQLLGQHALGLVLSTELADDVSGGVSYFQSPVDGSGTVATNVVWTQSDNLTLVLNVLVPWGGAPAGGIPTSEWGSSPISLFLQARVYD
ncbi:MAG: hypothetical protein M3Y87_16330 [Myxococcota bacterium]|nr:hypothetical protein [Myxococcota bacterium]